jgi:hypothetical protein
MLYVFYLYKIALGTYFVCDPAQPSQDRTYGKLLVQSVVVVYDRSTILPITIVHDRASFSKIDDFLHLS